MKKVILYKILYWLSQLILHKYKPDIIGITGSVGKTSTKEAIFTVLKNSISVRQSAKNYNNELGVPLTILGSESASNSWWGWFIIIMRALFLWLQKNPQYPHVLVLEMGADHIGDIEYLVNMAPCKVGVLTAVSESHLEFFGDLATVAKEKGMIISHLADSNWAIINRDNEMAWQQRSRTKAQVISYGIKKQADFRASDINISWRQGKIGLSFKLSYQGTILPIFVPEIISEQQVYALLAAAAIGIIYDMNLVEIGQALQDYHGIAGRTRWLPGIKNTQVIDDTYNSSPLAAEAALELLVKIDFLSEKEKGRRWAILGDMLELGDQSEVAHRTLGHKVAELGIDYLVSFGERARDIARGAKEAGMLDDYIFTFSDHDRAGHFIQNKIKENDIILIKGSQGVRMEKLVKEIMAEPQRANELLVRQTKEWQ
ncbi:MAG: UDP-N-acetylmuramoyl-tripeptide--D-alanyl-D-alanine ligase [Candidatus Komeilibacteria bacterium]